MMAFGALEEDAAAPLLKQGQVPHKLQTSAQALFGVHEDRLPLEIAAVPSWLRRTPPLECLCLQSPFILRPTTAIITCRQIDHRSIRAAVRMIGTAGQRAIKS